MTVYNLSSESRRGSLGSFLFNDLETIDECISCWFRMQIGVKRSWLLLLRQLALVVRDVLERAPPSWMLQMLILWIGPLDKVSWRIDNVVEHPLELFLGLLHNVIFLLLLSPHFRICLLKVQLLLMLIWCVPKIQVFPHFQLIICYSRYHSQPDHALTIIKWINELQHVIVNVQVCPHWDCLVMQWATVTLTVGQEGPESAAVELHR